MEPTTPSTRDQPIVRRHYQTALNVLKSARACERDARLLGNVRAEDLGDLIERYFELVSSIDPLAPIKAMPFQFWHCPNGCRGFVRWNVYGIATCDDCHARSDGTVLADSACMKCLCDNWVEIKEHSPATGDVSEHYKQCRECGNRDGI